MPELTSTEKQNVNLVDESYAAFNSGNLDKIMGNISDDVHWVEPEGFPLAGVYEGKEEVKRFLGRIPETLGRVEIDVQENVAAGDRVYSHVIINGTAPNGTDYEVRALQYCRIRDGKIVAFEDFGDTATLDRALRGQK